MLDPNTNTIATRTAVDILVQGDSSKTADGLLQCSKAGGSPDVSCSVTSSAAVSVTTGKVQNAADGASHSNTQQLQPQMAEPQAAQVSKQHKAAPKTLKGPGSLAKHNGKPSSVSAGSSTAAASNSKQKLVRAAGKAASSAISSTSRISPGSGVSATAAAASTALAAAKLGLHEQLASALAVAPAAAALRDVDGRCCLHYAAVYGHEECIDTLLAKGGGEAVRVRDQSGDLPLHLAAQKGQPMCAYNIAKACPASCLVKNKRGATPIDLAATAARGEVLNALLLACAGDGKSAVAVAAMRALLAAGAVPDTWAPNGSSALMLAAAADGVTALEVLLDNGASIELQDALGRSALMFAAGNNAAAACRLLLDRNASLSARDRRGRAALEYATAGSEAAVLLQQRLEELEKVASQLQQQLLLEQGTGSGSGSSSKGSGALVGAAGDGAAAGVSSNCTTSSGAKKKRKKKKSESKVAAAVGSDGVDAASVAEVAAAANPAAAAAAEDARTIQDTDLTTSAAADSSESIGNQQQQSGAASDHMSRQPTKQPQPAGHCQQQQQLLPSNAARTAAPAVEATSSAAAAAAPENSAEVQGASDAAEQAAEDWQVVLPKGKQRAPAAAAAPGESSNNASGTAARAGYSTARPASLGSGCKQQQRGSVAAASAVVRQQQQSAGPSSSSSNAMAAAKIDVVPGFTNGSCHLNPLNTGHRRHGSSHSLCSTASIASYESYCSSSAAGCGAAAAAGTPMSSCCSCISCCNHHMPQQQQAAHKPAAWGGAAAATAAAAAAAAAAAKARDISSNSSIADCTTAAADSAGQSKQAAHAAVGCDSSSQHRLATCTYTAVQDPTAAASSSSSSSREMDSSAGFKAALLGPRGTVSIAAVADAAAAAAASGSSPEPYPPLPPHPTAAASRSARINTPAAQQPMSDSECKTCTAVTTASAYQQQRQQEVDLLQQQLQQSQAEVAALKQLLKQQAVTHQQELAAVLEDAATHEAAAVSTAAQAAAAETLQSPLLRQLLAAAAQQAVLTERARMQLRLSQLGLPLAAQVQLMLGPLTGLEAVLSPVAGAAAGTAASAALAKPKVPGADDTPAAAGSPAVGCLFNDCLAAGRTSPGCTDSSGSTSETLIRDSSASICSAVQQLQQQQQQQQQHNHYCDVGRDAMLSDLKLDLRSEYCGGGSAFVAPAKQVCKDIAAAAAAAQSGGRSVVVPESAVEKQQADSATEASAYCSLDGDWKLKGSHSAGPNDCGNSSRRCSSITGYFPDEVAASCTAAATRSSSSSSLELSNTDDAEIQEAHVGGFGAIGGPPSCHNSFGSPRSSYSGGRALSCSPAAAATGAAAGSITFSCPPAVAAAAGGAGGVTASGSFADSPTLGTSQWLGRSFRSNLLGTSQGSFTGTLHLPQLSQPATPVFANCCGTAFGALGEPEMELCAAEAAVDPLEHQLVGGLLMDEDYVIADKCTNAVVSGKRCSAVSGRSVVDLLPDQL